MIAVYIAGPYSNGDVAVNVRKAIDAGIAVADAGLCPYIPHLSHFAHMIHPRDYDFWMKLDERWISACDCMLRLDGYSPGADEESTQAIAEGKPVFRMLGDLFEWAKERGRCYAT